MKQVDNPQTKTYKKKANIRFWIYRSIELISFVVAISLSIVFEVLYKNVSDGLFNTIYILGSLSLFQLLFMSVKTVIEKQKPYGMEPVSKMMIAHFYGLICCLIILVLIMISASSEAGFLNDNNVFVYWLIFVITYFAGYIAIMTFITYRYNRKIVMLRIKKNAQSQKEEDSHE